MRYRAQFTHVHHYGDSSKAVPGYSSEEVSARRTEKEANLNMCRRLGKADSIESVAKETS
jgi:hypothetical protein